MSNSLPAGFFITTIDGQRCTAVPRSSTTLTGSLATAAAAQAPTTTTTQTTVQTTNVNPPQIQGGGVPNVVPAASTSTSTAAIAASVVSTSPLPNSPTPIAPSISSSSSPLPTVSSTPAAVPVVVHSTKTTQTPASFSDSAQPSSQDSSSIASSSAPTALPQSDSNPSPTQIMGNNNGNGFQAPSNTIPILPTHTASGQDSNPSPAVAAASPVSSVAVGPIVGGVFGSLALIGIVGVILWCMRRRRRGRESLLTPLTTGRRTSFYDNDNASVGPTGRGQRWKEELGYQVDRVRTLGWNLKAGIGGVGTSLKSKVAGRDRSDSPSVNLNRGNSQFLDGPIPQHSRNNSVLSEKDGKVTLAERAADWWDGVKEKSNFNNWRLRRKPNDSADPFAVARGMTEKQANMNNPPDFSQLLGMGDRDLQLQAERRRISLAGNTGSIPELGSLGLNFGSTLENPFADPAAAPTSQNRPSANQNPFLDSPTRPEASVPKPNTYIADIRRSRGQSIDKTNNMKNATSMYRPPSTAVGSRYPSSIPFSRDSYRDTVFSSFSTNVRKGKGRSDPFDLERPDLLRARENSADMYPDPLNMSSTNPLGVTKLEAKDFKSGSGAQAGQLNGNQQRVMSTMSATSKYSSGISSLDGWGEPGPDLGPGSGTSSMRGNASSNGGSGDYTSGRVANGGLMEMRREIDSNRAKDNVSPVSFESKASSKNVVGKAM